MNYKKAFFLAVENGMISKINALHCLNRAKYGRLTCELCGHPLAKVSVDHIIRKSKGGTDELLNLRLTHYKCNQKRSSKFSLMDLIRLLF